MLERLAILLVAIAAAGGSASGQPPSTRTAGTEPAVTFRSTVNFVEVHAVVTDARGAFVGDLSKEDFDIYEDGKKRIATVFSLINLPVVERTVAATRTRDARGAVESDVRSTTGRFEGRIYFLVMDDLHVSFTHSQVVRDAAREFIERYFGDHDLAAVVFTSGQQDSAQELTGSRRLLLASIDKFQGRKLPSAGKEKLAVHHDNQILLTNNDTEELRTPERLVDAELTRDPDDAERGLNARRALQLIDDVVKCVADVQGRRKAILLFSEGIDYDIYDSFYRGPSSSASAVVAYTRHAVASAQAANVSVYGIDPRGLTRLDADTIDVGGLSSFPSLDFGTVQGFTHELLLAQESLMSLAEETGGFALVNTNDIAGGLRRIVQDNSRYYLLGYESEPGRAGQFRKIELIVKRPGLQVRARRGYLPADPKAAGKVREAEVKAGTSPALKAALGLPLPVGSLPLRVFAASFKGAGKNASVLVVLEIDGSVLQFQEREGRFYETVEVSIVAVDQRTKIQGGDRLTFDLKLLPKTLQWMRRTGVRLLSRLDLPPARYQIRVGAFDKVGGGIGTVPYDLEVPDYSASPLALSGIVLSSSGAASTATVPATDAQLKDSLSTPPVAVRSFTSDDTLTVFTEVYDNSSRGAHGVNLVATVQDARDGRIVFDTRDARSMRASTGSETHGFTAEVPLRTLNPGSYVLHVQATSTLARQSVTRDVPIEVQDRR